MPLENRESMPLEGMEHSNVTPESPEMSKRDYNFPEIMKEMEPAVVLCVKQLKEAIETGKYNTLISDDAKGRLPTLILRKIFAEKAPNAKTMPTYFLAFGREKYRWDNAMDEFVKKHKDTFGKALVVTDYIHQGQTLDNIEQAFDWKNKYTDYDIVSLFTNQSYINSLERDDEARRKGEYMLSRGRVNTDKRVSHPLITGTITDGEPDMTRSRDDEKINLRVLGGVSRRSVQSIFADLSMWHEDRYPGYTVGAHPERLDKFRANPEPTQEEMRARRPYGLRLKNDDIEADISEHTGDKYDRQLTAVVRNEIIQARAAQSSAAGSMSNKPGNTKEIQNLINLAREDVETMAKRIIAEVWVDTNE
jgi:hypothetical protein